MPSEIKPDAKPWTVKEQVFDDLRLAGIRLEFRHDGAGHPCLVVSGPAIKCGNMMYGFAPTGELVSAGIYTGGTCQVPSAVAPVNQAAV